jgi:hypothetical protein
LIDWESLARVPGPLHHTASLICAMERVHLAAEPPCRKTPDLRMGASLCGSLLISVVVAPFFLIGLCRLKPASFKAGESLKQALPPS